MSKDIVINADTSLEDLQNAIYELIYSNNIKYNETEKKYLIDICDKHIKGYYKDIVGDLRYLKNSIKISSIMKQLPDFIIDKENQQEIINIYQQGSKVMTFEKDQISRMKKYIKDAKKNNKYDNAPLAYSVFMGLIRSHIATNNYVATRKEIIYNDNRNIHYEPVKRYELPSEEYQDTIKLAIDKLYGVEIPEKKNKKIKCK